MATQQGIIKEFMPTKTFAKKDGGTGSTRTFVIDFKDGQYDSSLAFDVSNDKTLEFLSKYNVGDTVEVHYSVKSRKWKDSWYTNCNCYKIESTVNGGSQHFPQPAAATETVAEPKTEGADQSDLPF